MKAFSTDLYVPNIAPDQRVANKTAIVTGAGSSGELGGTGADIAILLAAKGANVVILDRDADRANHTKAAIDRFEGNAIVSITDLTDYKSCQAAADLANRTFGRLDILVNNAAIIPKESGNEAAWHQIIDVNLTGARSMTEAVLPHMTAQKAGSIVHISSIAGTHGGAGIAYSASKGGMIAMTKAQAFEYGVHGIRVNSVAPGHVAIPMGLSFQGYSGAPDDPLRARRARASLLGIEGTGWDVAYAVLFLASDESSFITGHVLPVDGGTSAVMPLMMASAISSPQ